MQREFQTFRVDANQPEIVDTFRRLGYSVSHTHMAGKGFPDIVVSKFKLNIPVEIKDGSKPPSARELTKPQRTWFFGWTGLKCVVKCVDDVYQIDQQVKALAAKIKAAGIDLNITGCTDPIYEPSLY